MKKLLLILLFVLPAAFAGLAQKTINDPNAEKRNVSSFHGIDVGTGIELVLTEGSTEEVAVSASTPEFRDKIVTKVEGGILKIHYESKLGAVNNRKEKKDLKAYVSYKKLDMLDVTTGAEVKIEGTLQAGSMKIKSNTGGVINGKVNIDDLEVNQGTGSIITFTGTAAKLAVDGDTGSMFKGIDLKTNVCSVTTSTGAGVYITVEKELNVKANTGGFVKYKGDAGIREIKTNTGGSVSKI